jgi:hypothetical protein
MTPPAFERDGLVPRKARKSWACDGDGSASHRHTPDCPRTIESGARYVECLWEAAVYQSGNRVSLPCAIAFYGWATGGDER